VRPNDNQQFGNAWIVCAGAPSLSALAMSAYWLSSAGFSMVSSLSFEAMPDHINDNYLMRVTFRTNPHQ
jgi:hypothetical protein